MLESHVAPGNILLSEYWDALVLHAVLPHSVPTMALQHLLDLYATCGRLLLGPWMRNDKPVSAGGPPLVRWCHGLGPGRYADMS